MTQSVNSYSTCLLTLLLCLFKWCGLFDLNNFDTDAFIIAPTRSPVRDVARNRGIFSTNDAAVSNSPIEIPVYNGPMLASHTDDDDLSLMDGIIELPELGIEIAVGPSTVVPGQLGLYCRCIDTVDAITLPECTLLCGYAKPGTFLDTDEGDKTVGFTLQSGTTAIFFERQLMTVQDALTKAATQYGNGSCGLAGHDLSMIDDDDMIVLQPVANGFKRYFCPDESKIEPIPIQCYGQYCNDLAWNQLSPPSNSDDYMERSKICNCMQLVWRLEYDTTTQCLVPTWPVSVISHDVRFQNHNFMELGTRYGWNYWQAIVNLDDLA